MKHELIERKVGLMAVLVVLVISVGGLVEIVPLIFDSQVRDPAEGVRPHTAMELAGRDVYIREGCYGCHSQMIRPFRAETERYGHYSLAGESVYERPFQFGSKRTGPDLARVGGLYSDEWHRLHLRNPRMLVPDSNMPAYPWLETRELNPRAVEKRMLALRRLGHPYSDEDIAAAAKAVSGKTEMDAMIVYLQSLGTNLGRGR
ncbi:cytochrome-c oxidase, cbb3-type subunit II [Wenzhouxiangella sp. XN24]|uniref:cytochrome-c oxidase, cbb3-type subunit II n=1 Tax=Wenzhouxiangella sp. XN24 TaxID=2713569 RepID=UPI0013EE1F45|nr:cytochrome-c oxidase, cbb3-type subunit II [Wenzhouxiangella sp. XN24]NGX15709.1 cytochrome-c oxidase, cbb3-type subunit II [Wenzhouxiangella sp. XN24]